MAATLKSEIIHVFKVGGNGNIWKEDITVYGCYEEGITPERKYDHYDVFYGEDHLNAGEVFDHFPTFAEVKLLIEAHLKGG